MADLHVEVAAEVVALTSKEGRKRLREGVQSLTASDLVGMSQGLLGLVSELHIKSAWHEVVEALRVEIDRELELFAHRYSLAVKGEKKAVANVAPAPHAHTGRAEARKGQPK